MGEQVMAWIEVIDESEADKELAVVYHEVKGARGKLSNVMRIHSLYPKSMLTHLAFYMSILFAKKGLRRENSEMIAIAVSAANRCDYCINHHAEALLHYWKDENRVRAFSEDPESVDLPPGKSAMIAYAVKLTKNPSEISEEDIWLLRHRGYSDRDILLINQTASYFNYVNRSVLGLGVEFSEAEIKGYSY